MRVIVVGGGAIGCATALALARRGVAVELLERDRVGDGASGAAAGMLAPLSESQTPGPFVPIGLSALREFSPWVDTVEALAGMRLDLVHSGVLMLAATGDEVALRDRLDWQRHHDPGATYLEGPALARLAPHLAAGTAGGLHYPNEVQVDARRYTWALKRAAQAAGAHIQEGTPVTAIRQEAGQATGVVTGRERLDADAVVIASGSDPALLRQVGADLPLVPIKGEMVRLLLAGPLARWPGPSSSPPAGTSCPRPTAASWWAPLSSPTTTTWGSPRAWWRPCWSSLGAWSQSWQRRGSSRPGPGCARACPTGCRPSARCRS